MPFSPSTMCGKMAAATKGKVCKEEEESNKIEGDKRGRYQMVRPINCRIGKGWTMRMRCAYRERRRGVLIPQ